MDDKERRQPHHHGWNENERKSSKSKHHSHKSSGGPARASTSKRHSPNHDDSSPSRHTKQSSSHAHRHRDTTEEDKSNRRHSDHVKSKSHGNTAAVQKDAAKEEKSSRRNSDHVKSKANTKPRDDEENVEDDPPKPPFIPSETATSPEAKRARIEKWRREGAKCLQQKQETEAVLRAMYSAQREDRRRPPQAQLPEYPPIESRRQSSHHGRVESNEPSRTSSLIEQFLMDQALRQRIAKAMSKSLRESSKKLSKKKKDQDFEDLDNANSEESFVPTTKSVTRAAAAVRSVKFGNTAEEWLPPSQPKIPSNVKSDTANSKSRATAATYNSKASLGAASSLSEPKKSDSWEHAVLKITNLPLSLTLNDLKSLFPKSTSVTFPMKQFDPDASQMSIGQAAENPTAYVKFSSAEFATEVLDQFQGLKIRGHTIKISVETEHSQ